MVIVAMQHDDVSSELPPACQKVAQCAADLGLEIEIVQLAQSSRTAQEAAAACDTAVANIVKSLVFRTENTGQPVLLLVSGSNRVDEAKVAEAIGEAVIRPDAAYVREVTGFAIGGIPPFGHASAIGCWIDKDLLDLDVVWSAAGTPNSVFASEPNALAAACGATKIAVCG